MKEKIIWITGASSGIGKELALKFIQEGYKVAVSSRNEQKLQNIFYEFEVLHQAIIKPIDVKSKSDIQKTAKFLCEKYDVLALITNAGITTFKEAKDTDLDTIDEIISTNLTGAIYLIQSILPYFIERNHGTFLNILSVAALKIFTASSAYAASKSGLLTYTKVLREELRNNNIKIINVLPGATATPIWPDNALKKYSEKMMLPKDLAEAVFTLFKLDKSVVPEEVVFRPLTGDL